MSSIVNEIDKIPKSNWNACHRKNFMWKYSCYWPTASGVSTFSFVNLIHNQMQTHFCFFFQINISVNCQIISSQVFRFANEVIHKVNLNMFNVMSLTIWIITNSWTSNIKPHRNGMRWYSIITRLVSQIQNQSIFSLHSSLNKQKKTDIHR